MAGPQVVVVGSGVMGAAVACFLARDHGIAATLLERDPSFAQASSALSASSIRVQFSQPVNIALSRWSLAFLRRVGEELATGDEPPGQRPSVGLVEPGYLYLAASAEGAAALRARQAVQQAAGAAVALLEPPALARRFPWLATGDLALGALGLSTADSGEGWFDGPALHRALRRKALACGARARTGTATAVETAGGRATALRLADGSRLPATHVVVATGAWSARLLDPFVPGGWPVRARKRDVFVVDSPAALPGCPLVIDPSGLWFRPEGHGFLCGAPPRGADADDAPLEEVDLDLFDAVLWPALAARVPGFEALRRRAAWAGYYEMNLHDHNGLAGALPGVEGLYTACGFSGHGMQQAPAVGAALAALVAGAACEAPSIDALGPARLWSGQRLVEDNVI